MADLPLSEDSSNAAATTKNDDASTSTRLALPERPSHETRLIAELQRLRVEYENALKSLNYRPQVFVAAMTLVLAFTLAFLIATISTGTTAMILLCVVIVTAGFLLVPYILVKKMYLPAKRDIERATQKLSEGLHGYIKAEWNLIRRHHLGLAEGIPTPASMPGTNAAARTAAQARLAYRMQFHLLSQLPDSVVLILQDGLKAQNVDVQDQHPRALTTDIDIVVTGPTMFSAAVSMQCIWLVDPRSLGAGSGLPPV